MRYPQAFLSTSSLVSLSADAIKGRVVDQTVKGADEHIDKLAKRYLNAERYPAHSSNVKRIILKIKPEKIFYVPPRYTEYFTLSYKSLTYTNYELCIFRINWIKENSIYSNVHSLALPCF